MKTTATDEKELISKCCRREAIEYGDGTDFMCAKCGLACEVTEVCVHCRDTGTISMRYEPDEDPIDKPCPFHAAI